ncbi:MAG: DUF5702 domain-containing protein [Saccharofermentanales bacterium]
MRIRSRRGSFSVFISIMMSSIIFLMSALLHVTVQTGREMIIRSALIQYQDLLLSNYSEILEDRYGLFAAGSIMKYDDAFYRMTGNAAGIEDLRAAGSRALSGAVLYDGILRFSKPRFPVLAAAQLIDRMNVLQSGFTQNVESIAGIEPIVLQSGNAGFLSGDAGLMSGDDPGDAGIGFDWIVSLLHGLKPDQFKKEDGSMPSNIDQPLEDIGKLIGEYDCKDEFDNEFSKTIKSDLSITEKTINGMSDFAERFYSLETSSIYDRLAFEFYAGQMFSCKVNFLSEDNGRNDRTDMRGRSLKYISPADEPEIEQMIFGFEEKDKNVFFAKISIEGIRFISNLIANLADSNKKAEIKSLAAGVCILVAVASGGTIVISPEAAEVVVLILQSSIQAAADYKKLITGGNVPLLPLERFSKINTYYVDYLKAMLLAVPKDIKLSRMESIIKKNTSGINTVFYTGIGVSCRYRGIRYFCENSYFTRTD